MQAKAVGPIRHNCPGGPPQKGFTRAVCETGRDGRDEPNGRNGQSGRNGQNGLNGWTERSERSERSYRTEGLCFRIL